MMTLNEIGSHAKEVSQVLDTPGSRERDMGLEEAARTLLEGEEEILEVNSRDYEKARSGDVSRGLLDRLRLTPARVQATVDGLLQVAALENLVGEILSMKLRPNGLQIRWKRVPLGAIGTIYGARLNVTADAFGLRFRSSNAVISKSGSSALYSNMAIIRCPRTGLPNAGLPGDSVQLIEDTSRDITRELMRLNRYIDVLTPKRGVGLIKTVVKNSAIPVIETSTGNCHACVNASADQNMALDIIFNAKTQRVGVRNAYKSLLVHRSIARRFLPLLRKKLEEKQVEIRGDEDACVIESSFVRITEKDWGRGYPDYTLSLKLAGSVDKVIRHINIYNTGRSETVVTSDYFNAQRFLNEVDATTVHVNTSTRSMDGGELGFEAEIGISTRELHARGPMGLKGLTTTKYIIYGDGQIC